jgi:hypothetical protein
MLILDGQYAVSCRPEAFSYESCLVCPIVGHRSADKRSSVGLLRTRIAEFIVIVNDFVIHKRPTVETWSLNSLRNVYQWQLFVDGCGRNTTLERRMSYLKGNNGFEFFNARWLLCVPQVAPFDVSVFRSRSFFMCLVQTFYSKLFSSSSLTEWTWWLTSVSLRLNL